MLCEIVYFSDLVKILNEDVILLTNKISEIIHQKIDSYNGIICKNLGDS